MSNHRSNNLERYNSIPDRWLRCPRKSLQLLVDKFLIFKTPLSHRYDSQVPEECLFPVHFVFNSMKSYNLKMGLWIDLTYTSRFYDRKEVEQHDCKYVKLQCRGFGETPSVEQTENFIAICHYFITHHPLEIIGIHCTHGFNRSGFMVVSYLVDKYDWELGAAILKFAEVRPPGIYKKEYLEELYRRYDDIDFVPQAPPLPDWHYEESENDDNSGEEIANEDSSDSSDIDNDETSCLDQGNTNKNNKRKRPKASHSKGKYKKRKTEFVKKNPVFMNGVSGVEPVTGPTLETIQKKVQELCNWKRNGFPGSQPVSMTLTNIELLSMKPYAVSWKADGVRYLMYIQKKNEIFFLDRDFSVFQVKNIGFPYRKDLNNHIKETLLDGEMVLDKVNGQNTPRFLVYDIVTLNGYPIGKEPFFPRRYEAIKKDVIEPRYEAMKVGIINKMKEPFSVRSKDFYQIDFAAKLLSDKFCESLLHEPDGLIFQPAKEPYAPGQCESLLKWKPPSLNSVDFKLKITTEKGVGILPKKVGELYVGGLSTKFAVLGSVKNLQDLDNKIIECKFENNTWIFMRERTDKSLPNSYNTALNVTESILHPVTQENLLSYIDKHRYCEPMPPPMAPPPRSHSARNRVF